MPDSEGGTIGGERGGMGGREGYPEEEFRVYPSDEHGHSERIWARVQPRHDRQMDIILTSHFFPYKTKGDIIRHAIARHLSWLETQAPVPSTLKEVEAVEEVLRDEEDHLNFKRLFDKLAENVNKYRSGGDNESALNLIARVRARIDRMPEGSWRDNYLTELDVRWGFLSSSKTAKLPKEQ